jgi:hypothetical protein
MTALLVLIALVVAGCAHPGDPPLEFVYDTGSMSFLSAAVPIPEHRIYVVGMADSSSSTLDEFSLSWTKPDAASAWAAPDEVEELTAPDGRQGRFITNRLRSAREPGLTSITMVIAGKGKVTWITTFGRAETVKRRAPEIKAWLRQHAE